MADLKKLIIREYPKAVAKTTPHGKFWKKFRFSAAIKEFGPITDLSFTSGAPYYYTVTSGTKVNIYNVGSNEIRQSISRFKKTAYSGNIRPDGRLVVAGSEDCSIQIFEVGSRAILRQMQGHARAVHVTRFAEDHVLSGGDDKTLRSWDLATGAEMLCMRGHEDYIRTATTVPTSPHIWISGGYDHTVRMWDRRSGENTMTLDHGAPVESVVVLPSGAIAISAGGNKIKVWDVHRGVGALATVSNHQKTITCLALDHTNTKLISASLDHQVKMYDLASYKVTHSIKYSAPVLSIGTTAKNSHLIAGCSDGLVQVRETPAVQVAPAKRRLADITPGSGAFFARGKNLPPGPREVVAEGFPKRAKLAPYDLHLKKFQYTEALDCALKNRQSPEIAISVMRELFRRDAMKRVLSGRNEITLQPILGFLVAHVTNPKYCTVLCDVTHILSDLYAPILGMSPAVDKLFDRLNKKLKFELKVQEQYMKLQGAMECFFTSTDIS